jgi:hypothetical protein
MDAMLATALHPTANTAAPFGDAAASPTAKSGDDGFSGALAALMSVLGPPPPVTATTSSQTSAGAGTAASGPAAGRFLPGSATGATTDPNGGAAATLVSGTADSAAALSPELILVQPDASLTGADAPASAASDPSSTVSSPASATPSATAATPAAPPIDPRLIPFVAKQLSAAQTQAGVGGPNVSSATAVAIQSDPGAAGQSADAAQSAAPAADPAAGAATTAAATAPVLSGLVLQAPLAPTATTGQATGDRAKAIKTSSESQTSSTSAITAAKADVAVEAKLAIAATAGAHDDAAFSLPHDGDAAHQAAQGADPQPNTPTSSQFAATLPGSLPPATANAATAASAALASAHGADITAQLASQIGNKAGAARTAFDFALEPQGLGRVDVSLKIDQQGQLSAVLSFDNPSAAAEAKSRAGELQQALQQAGLDVGQSGLSFTFSGGQGQSAAWQTPAAMSHAALPTLADATPDTVTQSAAPVASSASGLDITI